MDERIIVGPRAGRDEPPAGPPPAGPPPGPPAPGGGPPGAPVPGGPPAGPPMSGGPPAGPPSSGGSPPGAEVPGAAPRQAVPLRASLYARRPPRWRAVVAIVVGLLLLALATWQVGLLEALAIWVLFSAFVLLWPSWPPPTVGEERAQAWPFEP
jgi:hypothetical protein